MCFLKTLARNVSLKNFAFHCLSPISPILLFCALHFCSLMSGILFDFSRSSRPQKLQKSSPTSSLKYKKKTRIMFASSPHLVQHQQRFSSALASTSRKNNTSKRAASKSLSRANAVAVVGTFFCFVLCVCFSARVLEFYPECDPSDVLRVSEDANS